MTEWITPTEPADAAIFISTTDDGMIELQCDNRSDLVLLKLDREKVRALAAALLRALREMKEGQP